MTENSTENTGRKYTAFFALLYTAITCGDIFAYMNGLYNSSFSAAFVAGIAVPFATMLAYYLMLMSLGRKAYNGAIAILAPTLFCCISGYLLNDRTGLYESLFSFLVPTIASVTVYIISKHNGSVSSRCAGAAFVQFIISAARVCALGAITAYSSKMRFSTVVFDGINGFVNEFISVYRQALDSASALYPGADTAMLNASAEHLEEMLISTVTLTPAIICAVMFFEIYIFTKVANYAARLAGLTDTREKFEVSSVTNVIFHICVVLLMLSLLFESETSGFTFGVMSILIFLIPNFLILGARRIFKKLTGVMSRAAGVVLMVFILFAGLMFSPYLLILIVTFFGTSEYRASKNTSSVG